MASVAMTPSDATAISPIVGISVLLLASGFGALAQPDAEPCAGPVYHRLDLWVGRFTVESPAGERLGTNRIEKSLGGCTIFEHWTSATGGEGKSLFYVDPRAESWRQVWVTASGLVKEKAELTEYSGPGIRFQGEVTYPQGIVLDRTTLEPLEGGRVRQHIEISPDGGASWRTVFDGMYVPEQ
jgi:hypothetical protein